jgi:alkylation response protein AidB-like acyl-CoA dehydrogenase
MARTQDLDLEIRIECRRDNVYAVKLASQALDRMQRMAGARGMYTSNPIQRAWRDVHAIGTHVVFNFQTAGEFFGRLELGLEPPARDPYF